METDQTGFPFPDLFKLGANVREDVCKTTHPICGDRNHTWILGSVLISPLGSLNLWSSVSWNGLRSGGHSVSSLTLVNADS